MAHSVWHSPRMLSTIFLKTNMKKRTTLSPWVKVVITVGFLMLVLLLWHLLASLYNVSFILPKPFDVCASFFGLLGTSLFWRSLVFSVLRIFLGAVLGCALGFLLGTLAGFSEIAHTLLLPVTSVIRATPVACFIILAWVFIGSDNLPIFISALMVLPVMFSSTVTGIRATDEGLLEAAHLYKLTPWQTVRVCYYPAMKHHLQNALYNCIGLAWKAGLAAEIIVHTEDSLGYEIWNAKAWEQNADALFAWTLAVVLVSFGFESLFRLIARKGEGRHV